MKLAFDEFDDLLIGQKDNANNYLNLSELIEANNITDDINVEFASSDKAVATIDNDGNVFGLKAGKTIITATVIAIAGDGSKNVYTAEGELTVKTIPLNSIAFDKVIKEMKLGATDTLSIIYNPQNTTDAKDVTWTSSNPSVISVENGKLTANAVGTADITAKVGDKTVTCTITVKEEKKAEQPKPVITNKKSDNKPAAKSVSKAKTGDNNNVVLFLVMFAAAVAMIGVITGKSLRRNRRQKIGQKYKYEENIKKGKAYKKFKQLVEKQGGDISYIDDINKFEKANYIKKVYSTKSGYINSMNAKEIGKVVCELGAGRIKKEDNIDSRVGIILNKKVSDRVEENEELLTIYAKSENDLERSEKKLKNIIEISENKVEKLDMILEILK